MSRSSLSAHGGGRKVHFVVSVFSHSQRESVAVWHYAHRCCSLRQFAATCLQFVLDKMYHATHTFWTAYMAFGALSLRAQVDCQIRCRSNKRFRVECEQFFPARLPHVSDSFVIETAVSRTVLVCCFVNLIR